MIGRTEIESPLVAHPALQPVVPCWSNPSRGERITPRISIMSVPSRTWTTVPLALVTVVPLGTLLYENPPPPTLIPVTLGAGSLALRTAWVTKRPPDPAIRMMRVIW